MIIFILVVQNNDLKSLTFSEVAIYKTLYVFIHATDCSQALQVVQLFKLDYFLIEENLPTISGPEFATALHTHPRMKQVPTIIFDTCCTLVVQEKKMSLLDETLPTIPQMKILVAIIDKMLLSSGRILLNPSSMN